MVLELSAPTVVAEDSRLEGSVTFASQAQIFGTVEGDVIQQGKDLLFVGLTGWVRGSISSQGPIIVSGRVEGNLHSKHSVELLPGSMVQGNIVTPSLKIQPGALFNGDITMRWAANRPKDLKHAA